LLVVTVVIFAAVCVGKSTIAKKGKTVEAEKTYGGATVEKVIGVDGPFSFRCDIKGWPAIVSRDIAVRIDGVGPPVIVAEEIRPNRFFELQTKKFLQDRLGKAKTVKLENIKRGRTFSLIADVIVDCNSIAEILIENGFARRLVPGDIVRQKQSGAETPGPILVASPRIAKDGSAKKAKESKGGFVASKSSKIFHSATCSHAKRISEANTVRFSKAAQATQTGRRPCKTCNPG
jgi:endonuclease YncB( thermonuclease family)